MRLGAPDYAALARFFAGLDAAWAEAWRTQPFTWAALVFAFVAVAYAAYHALERNGWRAAFWGIMSAALLAFAFAVAPHEQAYAARSAEIAAAEARMAP